MNYKQLESVLKNEITYENKSDEMILEHFKKNFDYEEYHDELVFIFHHAREFMNRNHIISLHRRQTGRTPMHIFHYILMTYVYSGTLKMKVEEEEITLHKGDIILLDRHVPHGVARTGKEDLGVNIILNDDYFSRRFINKLPDNVLISQFLLELMNKQESHTHYLVFHASEDDHILNCIQNILCEYFDYGFSSDDIIDNYIMLLITYLARIEEVHTNLSITLFKNQKLLDNILSYIKENYKEGNLNTMCQDFGYDPSYTSKLIKKFSGKTFKQLVNEERMRQSLILLQNKETPIYTIAEDVGFSNLTSFYKKFEEFTGLKPQEYREKNT